MATIKTSLFFGAGASVFMDLSTTKQLMTQFLNGHQSCNISSIIMNYENKNIEDLYSDINQLLELRTNGVLPHLPIACANDDMIDYIHQMEDDEYDSIQSQCNEHPHLNTIKNEPYFDLIQNTLKRLKNSLGQHVFESLKYDEKRLFEYCTVIKRLRAVTNNRPMEIITTNYDLLIENCCDMLRYDVIDGFDKLPSGGTVQKCGSLQAPSNSCVTDHRI